jgi:hypothetical protein
MIEEVVPLFELFSAVVYAAEKYLRPSIGFHIIVLDIGKISGIRENESRSQHLKVKIFSSLYYDLVVLGDTALLLNFAMKKLIEFIFGFKVLKRKFYQ